MISDLWQGLVRFTRLPLLHFDLLCRTLYISRLTCNKWSCKCDAHDAHEFHVFIQNKGLDIHLRRVPHLNQWIKKSFPHNMEMIYFYNYSLRL